MFMIMNGVSCCLNADCRLDEYPETALLDGRRNVCMLAEAASDSRRMRKSIMRGTRELSVGGLLVIMVALLVTAAEDKDGSAPVIARLQRFQTLIGPWRGIGQPKRGSNAGAWKETVDTAWDLKRDQTGIRWSAKDATQWKSAWLSSPGDNEYILKATLADDTVQEFRGKLDKDRLVLESTPVEGQDIHRATITFLNENRWTLLLEKRGGQQTFYQRIAEIGYQREGTRLAVAGTTGPECVVTGGLGTIAVQHAGKTYYVCCTGCRDAFNDDPEGILKAYAERKTAKKP